jgi:RimJ/RimL family protein N-acetyltransferase
VEVKFVQFDREFLDASFVWLQNEALLKLIDAVPFTRDEQEIWFHQLDKMDNYFIWGVIADDVPIGVCGVKHVAKGKGEYWGYIGKEDYRRKGIGKQMIAFIEDFSLSIGLKEVVLKVLLLNEQAYGFYLKRGYNVYEQHKNLLFMRKAIGND